MPVNQRNKMQLVPCQYPDCSRPASGLVVFTPERELRLCSEHMRLYPDIPGAKYITGPIMPWNAPELQSAHCEWPNCNKQVQDAIVYYSDGDCHFFCPDHAEIEANHPKPRGKAPWDDV